MEAASEGVATNISCARSSRNCELLIGLDNLHTSRCEESGITDADAILNATAVGLVIEVWRNGPVEDMHSSRKGPTDAVMFAESTALHAEALNALTAKNQNFGLIDFEEHLLNRGRPWAGTGGRTLRDLGYGFLGEYDRHVKNRTNALLGLSNHTCVREPLQVYLVNRALTYGADHKGMPEWSVIVQRIGILLANPSHSEWRDPSRGAEALADMPAATPPIGQLTTVPLKNPSALTVDVLEWLSKYLLHCAGPPYGPSWEDHQTTPNLAGDEPTNTRLDKTTESSRHQIEESD